MTMLPAGRAPLTDIERERLGGFLRRLRNPDRLTLEGLDGLFGALIVGPYTVLPSEYGTRRRYAAVVSAMGHQG